MTIMFLGYMFLFLLAMGQNVALMWFVYGLWPRSWVLLLLMTLSGVALSLFAKYATKEDK